MNKYRIASFTLFLAALFLIVLNVIGIFYSPHSYYDHLLDIAYAEQPHIPGYTHRKHDTYQLKNLLTDPTQKLDISSANQVVFGSLRHSGDRKIAFYENWLLYLVGKFYPPMERTQDVGKIIAGGGSDL